MEIKGNVTINYMKSTFSIQIVDRQSRVLVESENYSFETKKKELISFKGKSIYLSFSSITAIVKCPEWIDQPEDFNIVYVLNSEEDYLKI